ncbi:MAG TPA: YkgJ family cysteine cluster protein [Bacteroidales bacterium]|nr:YkgJ family cysteine cluster protein [Bacteroidales bacterium]
MKNPAGSITLEQIRQNAAREKAENKRFMAKLSKQDSRKLDEAFHSFHGEVFAQVDCLDCANCCLTLGPRITDRDIQKIAKALKVKPSQLVSDYLRVDEDGDYVFKSMPCPFLDSDNYCRIYNDRPAACREYPHTDRPRMYQVLDITLNNIPVCPAVYLIVGKLKLLFD